MSVTIRLFAIFREELGADEITLELSDLGSPDVAGVWREITERAPKFAGNERFVRFAVNHEFVDSEHELQDGDEVALIPPVSGGSGSERFKVQESVLQVETVVSTVRRPRAGAIVTFEGVVRDHTANRAVDFLSYEVYPEMVVKQLAAIAVGIEQEFDDVQIAIHHRYGRVEIEEAAVVIAVSSPHRDDAFSACSKTIVRLKEDVPIWKKEYSPNGDVWVGWGS